MTRREYKNAVSKTPFYLLDERLLIKNLETLRRVADESGCRILLAQKGFSMYRVYPLISKYLHGTTASSLFEARLGHEEMGGETHIYSPAYRSDEFAEILKYAGHIIFNSFDEWEKHKAKASASGVLCGMRVNPGYSEVETEIYNPCARGSRLGVTYERFDESALKGIEGLHFHTMCEQNSDTLKRTLGVFLEKFGKYLYGMKWVNFGGGHHITRVDYDIDTLIECIVSVRKEYGVEVYLEPGEAVALNSGFLVASVLSVVENGMKIAVLDTSAACHMPDVLEMPYRPEIIGAGKPGEKPHTYRLAGPTCLAGDVIGDYSFAEPLRSGDRLVFCDMAHYTMVKNNTFNGINLPSIAVLRASGEVTVVKEFGYEDFKRRL